MLYFIVVVVVLAVEIYMIFITAHNLHINCYSSDAFSALHKYPSNHNLTMGNYSRDICH